MPDYVLYTAIATLVIGLAIMFAIPDTFSPKGYNKEAGTSEFELIKSSERGYHRKVFIIACNTIIAIILLLKYFFI